MNLFFSTAYAQEVAPAPNATSSILFFGGFLLLFYFILWRPQSKRAKEHRELLSAITKGDEVMTSGGLLGKVTKVSDEYVVVKVAENVELKMQKSSIAGALPKGTINQI